MIGAPTAEEKIPTKEGQILAKVSQWHDDFEQSPAWPDLPAPDRQHSRAITQAFARYAYSHLGLAVEAWTPDTVWSCCTDLLPRKLAAEPAFFEAMSSVLSAFFLFLQDQSLLPHGRLLAEAAANARKAIVANAWDRANWSVAKRFMMDVHRTGVDPHDHVGLQAYMIGFNLHPAVVLPTSSAHPCRQIQAELPLFQA